MLKTVPEITAFFDESGAHGGADDVFTVGGFVARASRWDRIDRVWDSRLGQRVFHMKDWERREGDFDGWPKDNKKRNALIAGLADTLHGNEVFGTAHCVHFNSFHELMCPSATRHQAKRLAYGILLTSCLYDVVDRFKAPKNEPISVICEEAEKGKMAGFATECFYGVKRRHPENAFRGITFAPKDAFRGLQAADMMAYEGFKFITHQVVNPGVFPVRKLLESLMRSDRILVAHANREDLEQGKARWLRRIGQLPPWP